MEWVVLFSDNARHIRHTLGKVEMCLDLYTRQAQLHLQTLVLYEQSEVSLMATYLKIATF